MKVNKSVFDGIPEYEPGRGVFIGKPFHPKEEPKVTLLKSDYDFLISEYKRFRNLSICLSKRLSEIENERK